MKVHSNKALVKYNNYFKTIFVLFSSNSWDKFEEIKNIKIMLNGDEIVAINISEVAEPGNLMLETKKIIKDNLKIEIDFEPQFIVVEIIETEKIPNTHLNVCKVNIGNEIIQIVCGATNAKKGLKTILATVGSWMPNGFQITKQKLNGHDSFGMLCSAKELDIKNKFNDSGIIELPNEIIVGTKLEELI